MKNRHSVTIVDVASLAKVAVSTASYALNGSPKVNRKTRERVLRAAKKLQYEPNANARSLKSSRTGIVGLFLNDAAGPFYSTIIQGIQEIVHENKLGFVICTNYGGGGSTAARFLKERRVDGAIILAGTLPDEVILRSADSGIPIVLLDRIIRHENMRSILIDNEKGFASAVDYLYGLGHRRIAFVGGCSGSYDAEARLKGYRKGLSGNGIAFDRELVFKGNFTKQSGVDAAKKITLLKKLPDAVLCGNDEMAIGLMEELNSSGIKVPRDISVAGFDDIELSVYVTPAMTTVRSPMSELGRKAAVALMEMISGDYGPQETVFLQTNLIIRKSCGKVRRSL